MWATAALANARIGSCGACTTAASTRSVTWPSCSRQRDLDQEKQHAQSRFSPARFLELTADHARQATGCSVVSARRKRPLDTQDHGRDPLTLIALACAPQSPASSQSFWRLAPAVRGVARMVEVGSPVSRKGRPR